MANINTRSPYYVQIGSVSMTYAICEIYIYTTGYTPPAQPTYTLRTDAVNQSAKFEISELIQDYLNPQLNNYSLNQNYNQTTWVDITTTAYDANDTNLISSSTTRNLASMGYGYFEDGSNPSNNAMMLISNREILIPEGHVTRFPLDTTKATNIAYMYKGNEIVNVSVSNTGLEGYNQWKYITSLATNGTNNNANDWYEAAEQNDYTVEDNTLLESYWNEGGTWQPIDNVIVEGSLGITTYKVKMIPCDQYEPIKVTFSNKFGAYQDIWFFGNHQKDLQTTKEKYKSNILNGINYDTYNPQQKILNKNGNEKLVINSGYYPENNNEVFKQLLLSRSVYISIDGEDYPAIISSSNIRFKTQLTEKLINYTINFEFAYDTINNIR